MEEIRGPIPLESTSSAMLLIPQNTWEIKQTLNRGKGVFARSDIEPWRVIGDYLGKIVRGEEEAQYDKKHDGLYGLWLGDDVTIFPDPAEVGVHLINHSCFPNCAMYPYRGHILYISIKKIFAGQELTVSYLLDPVGDDDYNLCFCGSKNCRGTMHVSKEISELWEKFVRERQGDYWLKRDIVFGRDLLPLQEYPDFVPEERIYRTISDLL